MILYETKSNKLIWLDSGKSPKIPKLIFSTKSIVHEVTTDQAYDYPSLNDSVNPETRWDNCSKGYFDECVSKLNSNGYFVDRALFRYAFRLFDGSYICASPVYYLEDKNEVYGLCRDRGNFYSQRADGSAGTTAAGRYTVRVQGFKPEFLFTELELEPWENIIVSIDIFTSGEALLAAETEEYDLVVLDIMMPRMDGYEFTRTLRAAQNDLPILMVTAKETPADKRKGFIIELSNNIHNVFGNMRLCYFIKTDVASHLFSQLFLCHSTFCSECIYFLAYRHVIPSFSCVYYTVCS